MIYVLHTHLYFPGWDLYNLRDVLIDLLFSVFRCDPYDLRDLDSVFWVASCAYTDLDLSHMVARFGSVWSARSGHVRR